MEYLRLLGVAIIVLGFSLRLDTIATVLISAIVTGLLAGITPVQLLEILGKGFVSTRVVSLFFLTLPMIGVIEASGLKEVAVRSVRGLKRLAPSWILNAYLLLRQVACAFGVALQGQVQFVRPLISPMVQAAAELRKQVSPKEEDLIKGRSAAVDNIGNFFAQNLFIASGGVLLIASTMKSLGYPVEPVQIIGASVPIALISLVITAVYNKLFDLHFKSSKHKEA